MTAGVVVVLLFDGALNSSMTRRLDENSSQPHSMICHPLCHKSAALIPSQRFI